MRAIEFKADIKDGIIEIPAEYKSLKNQVARVIILTEDKSETNPDSLESVLKAIQERKVFGEIDDPVRWQQSLREEWNERLD